MDFTFTWILLLWIQLNFISVQASDSSSNKPQCSEGQICRNSNHGNCETAVPCYSGTDCGGTPGTDCVADYCQPPTCTATGECVYGQKCSQDADPRTCVYPVVLKVEEMMELVLNFTEPGSGGPYEEITWYKDQTGASEYRIVFVQPSATGGEPLYYNDYCSGSSPCETSSKGELNVDTGEMTIYSVMISDEGFYYYNFYIDGGTPDTGHKYEIYMQVYVPPKQDDLILTGIPDNYVEIGTELDLNCTISRIKPAAAEIYWEIGGIRHNGSDEEKSENGDGAFSQSNILKYMVAKEEEFKTIKCFVVPVHGDSISVEQTINPGYGPTGLPKLEPTKSYKHVGQNANLTCNKPNDDDGNPNCNNYTWIRKEDNGEFSSSESNIWTFPMEESLAGNYTCTCRNDFGTSNFSNTAEVIFVPGKAPPTEAPGTASSGVNVAIIGGAIGGGVAVLLIVIIAIFLMRRRKKPPKAQPAEPVYAEMQQTSHSDDEMGRSPQKNGSAEPLYAQPSKRKLRPQRGLDQGPQYENAEKLRQESPYENTKIDNNNPPPKQENGNPDGVVYTEVNIGKDGKPRPKERNSIKKKVHQKEEPTVYAEIVPGGKSGETK